MCTTQILCAFGDPPQLLRLKHLYTGKPKETHDVTWGDGRSFDEMCVGSATLVDF
jgi:hypothetical protein